MSQSFESKHRYVVVTFARFGPYHLARLEAAGRLLSEKGICLIGLEVAGKDREYLWNVEHGCQNFSRMTLFPDEHYQDLPKHTIARAVEKTLNEVRPLAVAAVGWGFPEARSALRWCKRHDTPVILMSETKRDDVPRVWWREWVKRRIVRQFDAAVVGGSPQKDYVVDLGISADRIFPGYDVVNNDYFGRESDLARREDGLWRRKLGLPDAYFLTCCRFVEKKNLAGLIDAYGIYRSKSRDPWGLVICGSGELQGRLQEKAESLGLKRIIWPGFVQVGDLPKYYGLASVFVLPSLIEPWGLVVNEAMACGLPILASRSSGCAYDLVHEGENGFRFDPRDPEALAGLMLRMSSGEVDLQAMGNASRRIISQWTPATFASSLWRAIGSACRLSGKTGNVKEDHSPRRGPDVNINKTAAMSNEASFSSTTPEEYAEGAPQIKHAVLRGLYRELAASVYREACGTCQQPSLLDLGAGEGSMTRPFLELGARVTVVDISERRLAALQASCTGHTDRLELICDDVWNAIAKARKNGRQFNIVTMNAFMHHIPDYIGLIREAMTVLAPEGLFFSFQDPMRYDSLGTFCRAFSNIAYYSWRVFRGDLVGGIKRCFRRARGVFLEDCPADLVDYHGVRNGVDQEAVCRLLESNGFDCRITQYFSTQSRAWQPIGIMLGLKNTFGVVAKRRPPAVLPRGMNTSARIRTER